MNIDELRARIAEIETELRSIHETAGDQALDEDQTRRWETLDTELGEARQALATATETEARAGRVARSRAAFGTRMAPRGTEDPIGEPDGIEQGYRGNNPWDLDAVTRSLHRDAPERAGRELRARALDAVEKVRGVNDASKQHITQLLDQFDIEEDDAEGRGARAIAAHIIATSSKEYTRAWSKAFKTAVRNGHPDVEALAVLQRAASLTDAAGGYAVPLPVDPTLILNDNGSVSPLRRIATVRTATTDVYRTVNATAVTASYDAEGSEVSDDTPVWANTDITMHMARGFLPFSIEIGGDYPNWTADTAFLLNDAKVNLENTKFVLGSGVGEPVGIVTALAGGAFEIASAAADTLALADVYKLDEELPERFYDQAQWLAHKKIYSALRQAGGSNLDDFWADLGKGQPSELLGHPVNNASAMDGVINATQDNRVAILGDWQYFWIIDRVGFSTELIPHLFHTANNRPSGQRGVFAYWRNGSDSVNDRAFRMLNVT
ncbi:phage major capsid protein [Saccharothrix australiensis]|uniref:HK97 family phage major capsid protein n=1 Tax=Saccharothrix australiensis TaxID=2072 RepID=A0A495VM11_9PSEU|nr:phage major capsid protein [Saccharothrix australiensis]RKT49355.1 HK97 family phage major capsid protein [Saccharothrix australiensis]